MPLWLLLLVGVVSVVAAVAVLGTWVLRIRTRRIAASRPRESLDTFRAEVVGLGIPDYVSGAVYRKFQECCSDVVPDFPVRAADGIAEVYGMVGEDLEEAAEELLAECGRVAPDRGRGESVVTVGDLAQFVARCRSMA
ncbi:MAG: hypothetical protein U0746_09865 [Gemmataceae bacterium]